VRVASEQHPSLRRFALLTLVTLFTSMGLSVQAETPQVAESSYQKNSAMFRWWLPAAKVDQNVVLDQLKSIANAGYKGVEICIHMGDSGYTREDMREYGWGTPAWNALYKSILMESNELGLRVDTTVSPAWPASVPAITPADEAASKELRFGRSDVFSGVFNGALPLPETIPNGMLPPPPGAPSPGDVGPNGLILEPSVEAQNKDVLVAVSAARIIGTETISKDIMIAWGDMPHETRRLTGKAMLLDPESLVEISTFQRSEDGRYHLNWTAPSEGQWQIFSYWARGTGQLHKEGAATSTPSYVINHISKAGAQALIDFWQEHLLTPDIERLLAENGGAIFEDSLELEYGGLVWSADLLEEFRRHRGYSLTPFLPLLAGSMVNGLASDSINLYELGNAQGRLDTAGDRVRRDLSETLTEMYLQNHVAPIQDWAKSKGLSYRAQAYGLGMDIVRVASEVSGPDGESLGFGPSVQGDDRFRMVAGGAHIGGNPIVADEVGALANEGYRLTWLDMLHWINKNLSAGANQMVFHGMPYSLSKISKWPGVSPFGFGLAGYWGERRPSWQFTNALAEYIGRAQSALQSGAPQVDLAFLHSQYGTASPVVEDQTLADLGFSYDILTPDALVRSGAELDTERGALSPAGYRALVIKDQSYLSEMAVKRLFELAKAGLPVIFVGRLPSASPFYFESDRHDAKVVQQVREMIALSHVQVVSDMAALPAVLDQLHIQPHLRMVKGNSVVVASRSDQHREVHFLHNRLDTENDIAFGLESRGWVYTENLWTGRLNTIGEDEQGNYRLALSGDEAILVINSSKPLPSAPSVVESASLGTLMEDWALKMEQWLPNNHGTFDPDLDRHWVDVGKTALVPWSDMPGLTASTVGVGYYSTNFTVTEGARCAGVSLGSIGDSAAVAVKINGHRVAVDLFKLTATACDLLKIGENRLEIDVASNLGNRLIASKQIAAPPWNPKQVIQYETNGLLGPVHVSLF